MGWGSGKEKVLWDKKGFLTWVQVMRFHMELFSIVSTGT